MRRRLEFRAALVGGGVATAAVIALLGLDPTGTVELLRARASDRLLSATAPKLAGPRIVALDIDPEALRREGPWPWRRDRIAALIEAAQAAGAAAIGVDILFPAPETQSPAALARRLAEDTGDADIRALAAALTDDDSRLAQASAKARVVLGFALSPTGGGAAPTTPVLARGKVDLGALWSAGGAVYPPSPLAAKAASGALSLPGDADGAVRRAPLLVAVAGALTPGLALETLRLARGGSAYLLDADPPRLSSGALSVALPRDGLLRLIPGVGVEIVSATDLSRLSLKDAIVFLGVSAPEAGGLRATPGDPLTPSFVIQARAAHQIAAGFAPQETAPALAWVLSAVLGAALIALAVLTPGVWAYAGAAVGGGAPFVCAYAAAGAAWLIDPIEIAAPALAGFAAAAATMSASARARARFLRARFERHLAPAVIARIADGEAPKLSGERRDITALFTDIEGFTGMVARASPEALVAALDGYFEGLTRIALAHGGLMDKFVGDATNVFFNMPFDLADHSTKALDCAQDMVAWSQAYAREPGPAAIRFGRTRVGLESGPALVGDVGGGAKLDYTAHGETVTAASRLEGANKETGGSICVGPGAAGRIAPARLRPIGSLALKGFAAPVAASAPWPAGASADWRARYLAAYALRETAAEEAMARFAELAGEVGDAVTASLARSQAEA